MSKKIKEAPSGGMSEIRSAMEVKTRISSIEARLNAGSYLTRDDLTFLYEIDRPISSFGGNRDPRIAGLRARRNQREDAAIVLDCYPDQIAWNREDISDSTRAYIGPLFPGIFSEFSYLDHVFASFPGQISREELVTGTQDPRQLLLEMERAGIKIEPAVAQIVDDPRYFSAPDQLSASQESKRVNWAQIFQLLGSIMARRGIQIKPDSPQVAERAQTVHLVRLDVADLGLSKRFPPIEELLARVDELGLEPCTAEIGLLYRLLYTNQPEGFPLHIILNPLSGSRINSAFKLTHHRDDNLGLELEQASPVNLGDTYHSNLFRVRE